MPGFFNRKPKKSKRQIINEKAEEIVSTISEGGVDSPQDAGRQALELTQDAMTANEEDANKLKELSPERKKEATELVNAIIKKIIEDENIPDEAAAELLIDLIRHDSKIVGVASAQKTASLLPDDALTTIIDVPEVGINDAQKIVPGIDDDYTRKKVQEELDLARLKNIYDTCDKISAEDKFVSELQKAIGSEGGNNIESNEILKRIIAKRLAYYYLKIGASPIYKYTKIMSPLQMLESHLADLTEKEYKNLEMSKEELKEYEEKYSVKGKKPFDQQKIVIQNTIISLLANEIAESYAKQSVSNRIIVIPNSDVIKNFSKEEEETLIKELEIACEREKSPLKRYQIQDIRNQIHGNVKTEEIEDLKCNLEAIQDEDLKKDIASGLDKILTIIQSLPEKDQGMMMEMIVKATNQVTEKVKEANKKEDNKKTAPNGDEPNL